MAMRNLFLILLIYINAISCASLKYDMEVVSIETLSDSTGLGLSDVKINYDIYNYTKETLTIEELYIMKCCYSLAEDSFPALKYPCVMYRNDTLFGQHKWRRELTIENPIIKIERNNKLRAKLIFDTQIICEFYREKYSNCMKIEEFLVDLAENGVFVFERDGVIVKKRLNKKIIFYDYGGGEVEFSYDYF